jgi:hypothetical protein
MFREEEEEKEEEDGSGVFFVVGPVLAALRRWVPVPREIPIVSVV